MPLPIDPATVTTADEIPGCRTVTSLGVAEGLAVALYTGILPGRQKSVLFDTMREAFLDMLTGASAHGANAIVGLRHVLPSNDRERVVLAYGTAVQVVKTST